MKADNLLFAALRRFARGFFLTFGGIFVTATITSLFADWLNWPSFAVGAGNISLYSFQAGTNGSLGVGAFHIAMLVGLINGVLVFRKSARRG